MFSPKTPRMKKQRIVVLFGDTLLMDTVEASLREYQELGVVRIHNTVVDVVEHLKALCPDLVIFDVGDSHSQFLLPLLREQPDIPLLCLDVTCSTVIALSCQQYTALTAHDLVQVIQLQVSGNGGLPVQARWR